MEFGLERFLDNVRIIAIDANPIPYPAHARNPGEHLFVNCHYSTDLASKPLADLYESARKDAVRIMQNLAANSSIRRFVGLVVVVYGHFPVSNLSRPARRRIYSLSLLTNNLPYRLDALTIDSLPSLHATEESQLNDIAELRHEKISAQQAASWKCPVPTTVFLSTPNK